MMLDTVCPPGLHRYVVTVLLPEGTTLADTVALLCEQVRLLDELTLTEAGTWFNVTSTVSVAVQGAIIMLLTDITYLPVVSTIGVSVLAPDTM